MFSRPSNEDVKSRAKAGVIVVQGRALQAKEQFTPLAKSAQLTASQGVYQARVWAAPRVERAGIVVQESIAPKVSSAMTTAGRRMQPVEVKTSRRRWPAILAGVVTVSAGAVAAILLRGQRANRFSDEPAPQEPPPPVPPADGPANSKEQSDASQVDVNGQVRTP